MCFPSPALAHQEFDNFGFPNAPAQEFKSFGFPAPLYSHTSIRPHSTPLHLHTSIPLNLSYTLILPCFYTPSIPPYLCDHIPLSTHPYLYTSAPWPGNLVGSVSQSGQLERHTKINPLKWQPKAMTSFVVLKGV